MDTDKLLQAINKLNLFLVNRRYYEDCECRDCDEVRSVTEARELLITFHTQVVSGETPSPESRAQALSKKLADGERPLAVVLQVERGSMRHALYFQGEIVMAGWINEIAEYAAKKGLDIHFMPRS